MSNNNKTQGTNNRQALSLIGQNATKSFSIDPQAKNFQEFLKNPSLENQSNQTISLSNNEKNVKTHTSFQPTPLEETLKNALKEAIEENEILRKRVTELEALFAAAEDEIEKKDKAILELYENLERGEKSSEVMRKTENFMRDPENLITVDFGKKKHEKINKNLNKSF